MGERLRLSVLTMIVSYNLSRTGVLSWFLATDIISERPAEAIALRL